MLKMLLGLDPIPEPPSTATINLFKAATPAKVALPKTFNLRRQRKNNTYILPVSNPVLLSAVANYYMYIRSTNKAAFRNVPSHDVQRVVLSYRIFLHSAFKRNPDHPTDFEYKNWSTLLRAQRHNNFYMVRKVMEMLEGHMVAVNPYALFHPYQPKELAAMKIELCTLIMLCERTLLKQKEII